MYAHGLVAGTDPKVNGQPTKAPTQWMAPKLLKETDNLPCDYHLIESRVKQMSDCWADEDELDDDHD